MKKTLSFLLALVMCFTCLSFSCTTALADEISTVSFTGYEHNAKAKTALDQINQERINSGYQTLTLDASLCNVARQRVKELFIYADYNDGLPTGQPITAYIPNYDDYTVTSLYGSIYTSAPTVSDITSKLYSLKYSSAANYQSIGISVFTYDDKTAYYAVLSMYPASSVCLDNYDAVSTAYVTTLQSNLSAVINAKADNKYARYNLSVIAYPAGYAYDMDITSQCTFKSSKSSVMKIKNGRAYPKKNGKVTITANGPAGTVSVSDVIDAFNNITVKNVSAKSPKKKQLKASWSYSISDAQGYEIQYSTSKKFTGKTTKKVTVKGKKTLSKTIKNLKSKKTYYVRVRAYINQGDGEKCYSSWSKTARIKVK